MTARLLRSEHSSASSARRSNRTLYTDLWLEGEVSDVSRSSAGHVYFSCVRRRVPQVHVFRGQALRQHHPLRFGDQVVVHGGLSIYPRSGAHAARCRPRSTSRARGSLGELEYLRQRLEAEALRPAPQAPAADIAWHDRCRDVAPWRRLA